MTVQTLLHILLTYDYVIRLFMCLQLFETVQADAAQHADGRQQILVIIAWQASHYKPALGVCKPTQQRCSC